MFIKKPDEPLIEQVRVFIKYRPQTIHIEPDDEALLILFARMTGKRDISEVDHEDIARFENYLRQSLTNYIRERVMRKIGALMRYYNFHRKFVDRPRRGRPANVEMIDTVRKLVDDGYSFRDAAREVNRNVSQVHRWYHFGRKGLAKPY